MKLVGEKLAKYKRLDGGVRFVEVIPKNATGKTLKRILKEEAQAEIKAGVSNL
jgi:acyl-coenzyme A synthetase/AMP-(fatty) acid ligase